MHKWVYFWLCSINNFCDVCFSLWLACTDIVSSTLSLVPLAPASCWSVRGGQGHEQSVSLGIRISVLALLRISWRSQGTRKEKDLFFSGSCISASVGLMFSSASVFIMHTHTCYTLQLWFHGHPCWFVRASWEIRATRGTVNVGVYFLFFFVQFNGRKVEEVKQTWKRRGKI